MGPKFVVIKKGEHGCMLCTKNDTFVLPAFPAEQVVDPTGAGDSFAGGMMGYLATQGGSISPATIKRALAFGTVLASYTISDFSLGGLKSATRDHIDERWLQFKQAMTF
jgi:sugar/nucleoside kinase (ribokinase family)